MISVVSVRAAMSEFSLNARPNSPSDKRAPAILILVDVEQFGDLVQIRVLLSIFNNLQRTNSICKSAFKYRLYDKVSIFQSDPAHLSCDGHPVEHVPQYDAHHHFVSQVEDHSFSIVVFLRPLSRHR